MIQVLQFTQLPNYPLTQFNHFKDIASRKRLAAAKKLERRERKDATS
jgi:hypothetical protein